MLEIDKYHSMRFFTHKNFIIRIRYQYYFDQYISL